MTNTRLLAAPAPWRVGAFFIDTVFARIMSLVVNAGWPDSMLMLGLTLTAYMLLRDAPGASLGKLIVGLRVVGEEGEPASLRSRILRNVPFAVPYALLLIPIVGSVLMLVAAPVINIAELVNLASTGRRQGDRLGHTGVVFARRVAAVD
jgi:uncharacterized RDD family membrane protein YckC